MGTLLSFAHRASPVHVFILAAAFPLMAASTCAVIAQWPPASRSVQAEGPATVTVRAAPFLYRETGDFYRDGLAVDPPRTQRILPRAVEIMAYQVSAADYDACAGQGACLPRDPKAARGADIPVTGVSFDDAQAYALWLSRRTGRSWRLPSDEELAFAAGSRYRDETLDQPQGSRNPALRWIAEYEREAERKAAREPHPQPFGTFGLNENGLADFAGNVWEWTSTCQRRVEGAGGRMRTDMSCGIYIVAGKHRAPLPSFVREPKSGGCSVGTPPDNVGFRLVREARWFDPLFSAMRRLSI